MENNSASLLVVPLGKPSAVLHRLGVVDRWPVTSNRARYDALIAFSR